MRNSTSRSFREQSRLETSFIKSLNHKQSHLETSFIKYLNYKQYRWETSFIKYLNHKQSRLETSFIKYLNHKQYQHASTSQQKAHVHSEGVSILPSHMHSNWIFPSHCRTWSPQDKSHFHSYSTPGWSAGHQNTSRRLAHSSTRSIINNKHNDTKKVNNKQYFTFHHLQLQKIPWKVFSTQSNKNMHAWHKQRASETETQPMTEGNVYKQRQMLGLSVRPVCILSWSLTM